jgi:hypothetical protein
MTESSCVSKPCCLQLLLLSLPLANSALLASMENANISAHTADAPLNVNLRLLALIAIAPSIYPGTTTTHILTCLPVVSRLANTTIDTMIATCNRKGRIMWLLRRNFYPVGSLSDGRSSACTDGYGWHRWLSVVACSYPFLSFRILRSYLDLAAHPRTCGQYLSYWFVSSFIIVTQWRPIHSFL